jgi:hypothetical protein
VEFTNLNKGEKMKKQMSEHAQVAKLLKQKAKQLGLEAKSSSQTYSGGTNAKIWIYSGGDQEVQELKDYANQFEYGEFDGMTDCYNVTNSRDDIPQVKYLFVNDERASQIMKSYPGNFWEYEFFVNGGEGSWSHFVYYLKKVFPDNKWQEVLKGYINEQFKFPYKGNGYVFEIKKPNKEAA